MLKTELQNAVKIGANTESLQEIYKILSPIEQAMNQPEVPAKPSHYFSEEPKDNAYYLMQHSIDGGFSLLFSTLMKNLKTLMGIDTSSESLIKKVTPDDKAPSL